MGFEVSEIEEVYTLTFEDASWNDANIRVRTASVETLMQINFLGEVRMSPILTKEEWQSVEGLANILAKHIESWNLERDGKPIPISGDGLLSLGFKVFWKLHNVWLLAMVGVPTPLPADSTSGEPLLVESIPMEQLPESQ